MSTQAKPYIWRLATAADSSRMHELLSHGAHVHAHLDWWLLEDWIGSPAFIVAEADGSLGGLSLAVCDGSPVAWWRALALDETLNPAAVLKAIIEPTLDGLRQLGASALTCMAFSDWLEAVLPGLDFERLTQVITLRKDDPCVPALDKNNVVIRPATQADVPGVLAVDQAAFDATWCYGFRALSRLQLTMMRMVVAEQGKGIVGYACGDMYKSIGHIVRLAVHPAHQGQNVGARLLADMLHSFFAAGAQAVTLNTQIDNTVSQKLYRRFDFQTVGYPTNVWQRLV